MNFKSPDDLLPDPHVCRRYGIAACTLWRWDKNPALAFPPAVRINGRKYRRLSDLEQWERGLPKEAAAA